MIEVSLEQVDGTSSREDDNPIVVAENVIAEYGRIVGLAFEDAAPLLYTALSSTYDAVLTLQDDPDLLAEYLDGKLPGPDSKNPIKPIVRKLWRGIPTRDTVHRYASCLAQAQRMNVPRGGFREWIKTQKGGIKAAARDWSRSSEAIDMKHQEMTEAAAVRAKHLSKSAPIPLPAAVAERQDGLYLAAIRVNGGHANLLAVLDQMAPSKVNQIIDAYFW